MYIYFAITGVKNIINILYQGPCYCLRLVTSRFQGIVDQIIDYSFFIKLYLIASGKGDINIVKAVNSNQYTVIISFDKNQIELNL